MDNRKLFFPRGVLLDFEEKVLPKILVKYKHDGETVVALSVREIINAALDGMGDAVQQAMSVLKALAFKDSASGSYTPAGSVSKPTFTGTAATIKPKVTAAGTVSKPTFTGTAATIKTKITAAGTVSKPNINVVTASKTIYSISGLGSLPSLQTVVEGEDLRLVWSPGGLPARTSEGVVASVNAELDAAPTFTGTEVEGSASYTPAGSVSKPTFTGTEVEGSASYTPAGSVSKPTFTGTQATITVS